MPAGGFYTALGRAGALTVTQAGPGRSCQGRQVETGGQGCTGILSQVIVSDGMTAAGPEAVSGSGRATAWNGAETP